MVLRETEISISKVGTQFCDELQNIGFLRKSNTKGSKCIVMLLEVKLFYLLDDICLSVDTARGNHSSRGYSLYHKQNYKNVNAAAPAYSGGHSAALRLTRLIGVFAPFTQPLQANAGIVPQITQQPSLFTPLPIRYSPFIYH